MSLAGICVLLAEGQSRLHGGQLGGFVHLYKRHIYSVLDPSADGKFGIAIRSTDDHLVDEPWAELFGALLVCTDALKNLKGWTFTKKIPGWLLRPHGNAGSN